MNFKSTNPNISRIEDYYNHFEEENRLSTRHGQVEFLTTIKYILEILNKALTDIGIGNIQIFLFDDKTNSEMNINANNVENLCKIDEDGNRKR